MVRTCLDFFTALSADALWPRRADHVVAIVVVIAQSPSARPEFWRMRIVALRTSLRLWRRLCCTFRVAGRPPSMSVNLALCTAQAVVQDTHVQQVRAGALQIGAKD